MGGHAILGFEAPFSEGLHKTDGMKKPILRQQFGSADSVFSKSFTRPSVKCLQYPNQNLGRHSEVLCQNSPRKGRPDIYDMPVHEARHFSGVKDNESYATSYKAFNKYIGPTADVHLHEIINENEGACKEQSSRSYNTAVPPPKGALSVENIEPLEFYAENNGAVWQSETQKHGGAVLQNRKINGRTNIFLEGQVADFRKTGNRKTDMGIRIVEFLKHKKLLITGSTGFLAKVLVEKILREQPDVGHLYLFINADSTEKANTRLVSEVQSSKLFQLIQEKYGTNFKHFMETKVTAVAGNFSKDGLGMDKQVEAELANKIDIIVNSAATTTFDERYDVAVDINTRGPLRLLEFGKKCPHLQLFLHISTAFVNGQRRGRVREKPFKMGESIAKELLGDHAAPGVDVREEIATAQRVLNESNSQSAVDQTSFLKKFGIQRAKLHGWQDTYVFTKAMGEMLVNEHRAQIPVVILRPSVVESTIAEPFSGWMEGLRMMDPILIAYGKGQISGFVADPQGVLDVVPADMVVNATLAAMAKHAQQPGLRIYQIGSSVVNPLVFDRISALLYQHFKAKPFFDQNGKPILIRKLRLFKSKDSLLVYNFFTNELPRKLAKFLPWLKPDSSEKRLSSLYQAASQQVSHLIDIYTPYTFYEGRFDISNTECLHQELSNDEKTKFGFEVKSIDWDNYIQHIHFPGLRKYPLRGRNTTTRL